MDLKFLKACNLATIFKLEDLKNTTQFHEIGLLNYLIEQSTKFPQMKNAIASDGKYKRYQIWSTPLICGEGSCDDDICDMNGQSTTGKFVDRYISKCHTSPSILIKVNQLRDLCQGQSETDYIADQIKKMIPSFIRGLDKKLAADLYAARGQFTDGTNIKSMQLINGDHKATAQALMIAEDLRVAGLGNQNISMIGGSVVRAYKTIVSNSGINQDGFDMSTLDLNPYIDYNVADVMPATRENVFVIADNVLSFVTWSENAGFFGSGEIVDVADKLKMLRASGGTYWKGIIDLAKVFPMLREKGLSSFIVDLHLKYDDCKDGGSLKMFLRLHYDIFLNEVEMCDYKNVNGIQHWQVCIPKPVACDPVTLPPPTPVLGAKCFGLPCAIPFVAYTASIDGAGITSQTNIQTIDELVLYLNQIQPGKFKVQGTQIEYKGSGSSVHVNGLALPQGACLQGDCYSSSTATPFTQAQKDAYEQLGATLVETSNLGTSATYTLNPNPNTTITLAQIIAVSTSNGDGATWVISPTCQ